MRFTEEDVRRQAAALDLELPAGDLAEIAARLSALVSTVRRLEQEHGEQLRQLEPIPPVFPSPDLHRPVR